MKNRFSDNYLELLNDRDFRNTAEALAIRSGIRTDLTGFSLLVDAIILYGTQTCVMSGKIYRIIAEVRDRQYKSVNRSISYDIRHSPDVHIRLSELVGIPFRECDIHSSMVISYLGTLFRNPAVAVYG